MRKMTTNQWIGTFFFQTDLDNQKEHSLEGLGCGYRRSWWDGTDGTQKELAPLTTCFY